MFEISIIFALLAMLCWGIGDFLIQKCTRKAGDLAALAYIGVIGALIFLPFAIKDYKLFFQVPNLIFLTFFSLITFIASILDFEALKRGKISVIEVILELELPVTIALAYFFLKESLSFIQFAIIGMIFIGIVLIATKSFAHWKTKLERGVVIALFAALGMGLVNFMAAHSSREISVPLTVFSVWIITAIFSLIFIIWSGKLKKCWKNAVKNKYLVISMGILDTFAWFFFMLAILENELAITTAITESYPAIAMFLGVWLNKERVNWHQYLGAGLALIASFLLAFFIS